MTAGAAVVAALLLGAAPAAADELPTRDVRSDDGAPIPDRVAAARAALAGRLGPAGTVAVDPVSGGVDSLGATNTLLTGPGAGDPADLALDFVRSRSNVLGLDAGDLAGLELTHEVTSPAGITHLLWAQTYRGVPSYDTYLAVNVAADGSIVNVTGAPVSDLSVPSIEPELSSAEALDAAHANVGRSGGEETARKVIFASPDGDRLAWKTEVWGDGSILYEIVVDATDGRILARSSLTDSVAPAQAYGYHPGAPNGGTAEGVDLDVDPEALNDSAGGTRLAGKYTHAYADVDADNIADPAEEIATSPLIPGTWIFPLTSVPPAANRVCSAFTTVCTWDGNEAAPATTEPTNRSQTTTQLFYFANRYHDWLEQAPIGFDDASGNFEVGGTGGDDRLLAEANDASRFNNANMNTPADGTSPRMQMFLWTNNGNAAVQIPAVSSSDDASIVYHEYTHGLIRRLVAGGQTANPLGSRQALALNEGLADWYAMDYLVANGYVSDSAATDGDVRLGEYVFNNTETGVRVNAIDCPVGSGDALSCPGNATAGPGGFTLNDLGRIFSYGTFGGDAYTTSNVHADGEVWSETMWDMRVALGADTTRGLLSEALRLAPAGLGILDLRDAFLQADLAQGGTNNAEIWEVFANRGMGYAARSASGNTTRPQASFDTPPLATPGAPKISDPPPLGDGDGAAEPGETVRVQIPLANQNATGLTAATGKLSGGSVFHGEPQVAYGDVPALGSSDPAGRYALTIPSATSCGGNLALQLAVNSGQGTEQMPVSISVGQPSGPVYSATDLPKAIPDATPTDQPVAGPVSTLDIPDAGDLQGLVVFVGTSHTWVQDLQGTLTSPSGTEVELFTRPGTGGVGGFVPAVTFDDAAAASIQDIPDNANASIQGSFRPDEALATLAGEPQQGTWKLRLFDADNGDSGSLTFFAVSPDEPTCSTTVTPPSASTDAGTPLGPTSARLNGALNPAGAATQYAFEYGPTAAYGSRTPVTDGGAGATDQPVSADLTGLAAAGTTHFRLVALRDGVVVAAGADQLVTTPGNPPDTVPPDTDPPETTIDSGPKKVKPKKRAKFAFSSDETGSSFECRVDEAGFAACASPATTAKFKRGKHVFQVRAVDPAGNADPTPATASWKVKKKRRK